jgi:hypothetical protein
MSYIASLCLKTEVDGWMDGWIDREMKEMDRKTRSNECW